jgi:hypothetical protein
MSVAYKMMKHINTLEKDTANLQVIQKKQWTEHYRNLWYDPNISEHEKSQREICTEDAVDPTE